MRSFTILAAVGAAFLVTGAASAKDKDQGDQPKEKKICRVEDQSTSRIAAHRICRTLTEWKSVDQEAQRDAARAVQSSTGRD